MSLLNLIGSDAVMCVSVTRSRSPPRHERLISLRLLKYIPVEGELIKRYDGIIEEPFPEAIVLDTLADAKVLAPAASVPDTFADAKVLGPAERLPVINDDTVVLPAESVPDMLADAKVLGPAERLPVTLTDVNVLGPAESLLTFAVAAEIEIGTSVPIPDTFEDIFTTVC